MRTPIAYFLILSGVLFTIGTIGVLIRRNALVIFMSIELQLNAVNLSLVERIRGLRPLALLLAAGLVTEVVLAVRLGVGISTRAAPNFDRAVNRGGNVRALAKVLFNSFFFPFEVTSVLLIVAAVAAIVMTRRPDQEPRLSDRGVRSPERGSPVPIGASYPPDPPVS